MARRYLTGFELNSNAAGIEVTAAGGSPNVQSTTVRSGTYALQISSLSSGTAKGVRINFLSTAGNGPWYFRTYFRYATAPSGDNQIIQLNDTNAFTTPVAYIILNSSGALELWDEDGQIGSDSSALSANTWYRVEMEFDRTAAAGSHVVRARINGTEFAGAANRDLSAGILTYNVGGNLLLETQTTGNWYFDDIAINDNTTTKNNSYPGDGEVIILLPTGDSSIAWSRGGTDSGANWSQVDEIPPNDITDYVQSNTLDQIDIYTLGNTPAAMESTDIINCVMPGVRFATDNATGSDPDITIGLVVGANNDESAAIDVSSTTWRTNDSGGVLLNYPQLANDSNCEVPGTSNAWTKSDLDSAQFRLRQAATDTHFARVSAVWVYVDHKPNPAQNFNVTITTTEAISDSAVLSAGRIVSIATTEAISDAIARIVGRMVLLTTTESISDTITKQQSLVRALTNSEGITDSVTKSGNFFRVFADSTGITDTVSRAKGVVISFLDTVGITDAISKALLKLASISDNVSISDTQSRIGLFIRQMTTQESITDSTTRTGTFRRSLTESLGIQDSTTKTASFIRGIADTTGVSDIITRSASFVRSIANTLGITDLISYIKSGGEKLISILDSVSISDSISRTGAFFRQISSSVGITDTISSLKNFTRLIVTIALQGLVDYIIPLLGENLFTINLRARAVHYINILGDTNAD